MRFTITLYICITKSAQNQVKNRLISEHPPPTSRKLVGKSRKRMNWQRSNTLTTTQSTGRLTHLKICANLLCYPGSFFIGRGCFGARPGIVGTLLANSLQVLWGRRYFIYQLVALLRLDEIESIIQFTTSSKCLVH